MTNRTVGIIGAGRIARILLGGWQRAGAMPARVVAGDPDPAALARLKQAHPGIIVAGADNTQPAAQDFVVLSIPRTAIETATAQIRSTLRPNAIVISPIGQHLPIATLVPLLGGFDRIVRVMPNAPSIVNAGFNPLVLSPALSDADRQAVIDLWKPLGDCPVVAEELLPAYAILTARGPAHFWFQFYELIRLAQAAGISQPQALAALEKMLAGAVATMARSGLTSEQVRDLIPTNPLGPAEATLIDLYRSTTAGIIPQK